MRGPWTLATDGCDRATAYHMSNKIIRRDGKLCVTWLDSDYRNILATVDPESGAVESRVIVGQGFDNHCGAALTLTPDDTLHVMNGSHHRGFAYSCTSSPTEPDSWSPPQAVGCRPTYPSLVSDLEGNLILAHRMVPMAGGRGGVVWCMKHGDAPWNHAAPLTEAPLPGYIYPTNALALAPDGTLHIAVEWYSTYPANTEEPHSMAVTHYETSDGEHWRHSDGREIKSLPIRITDAEPIIFKSDANLRSGNMAVLPDGRPCVGIWDSVASALLLAVHGTGRVWSVHDVTGEVNALCPGTRANAQPQIAATPDGGLIMATTRAQSGAWADVASELHVFRVAPDSGEILRHDAIEKTNPDEPDWLPSIEKEVLGRYSEAPYLTYITGRRGVGCINTTQCEVKMVQLT